MTADPDAADGDAAEGVDGLDALAPASRRAPRGVRVRLGIGAAALLLVAALVVTVTVSLVTPHGASQSVTAVTAQTRSGPNATNAPTESPPTALYVHVLGAVARPGLYQLRSGTRVVDAIAAAGGFTDDANQGGVNLARPLADGEQLAVPRVGEAPVPVSGADGVPGAARTDGVAAAKINLNTATEQELETLPRVGPAMADRILQWRKDNTRFTTVDDLMNVTGIGDKTFAALKDLVTV